MYHRSDEARYYKTVLLPLELKTRRRINRAAARRRGERAFEEVRKALKELRLDRVWRILKRTWSAERAARRRIRQESAAPAGISPEQQCFTNHRIAVYTAVFGNYDSVQEPLFCPDNVDHFIFTDGDIPPKSKWVKLPWEGLMDAAQMTGTEKNRYLKMHPHLLFPDHEYSVYVDGNILITADITPLAMGAESFPVAMHTHKDRDCVYEEIDACIEKRKDTPEALNRQRLTLQQLGIPPHWGLLEAPVIARRHHDPRCKEIMENWWECFCIGCRRDQIALIRCLWELNIPPQTLGTLGSSVMESTKFIWAPHKRPKPH